MKRLTMSAAGLLAVLGLALGPCLQAQTPTPSPELKPALVEKPMPDFTLPLYQGGELSLSKLRGKNVVLIVPRFMAAPGAYCTIDDYQYLDIVDAEKMNQLQKKFNAEIVFLFPFGRDEVAKRLKSLPEQMDKIRSAKNPPDLSKLDDKGKARMERWRVLFPKDFSLKPGEVPTPFPILLDADRTISKGLGVFSSDWSGSKVEQGIPSVFIIDAQGRLMFKYIGQSPADRPSPEYLGNVLAMITASK
jgi:peroxiredoxin